jgi:drug/metabolite transporter (DMT)-like permease
MLLYLAVFGSAIAQNLWLWLLKEEDVTVVASSSFLIPVIAVVLGWLVLAERLTLAPIVGIVLILTGTYLVHRP